MVTDSYSFKVEKNKLVSIWYSSVSGEDWCRWVVGMGRGEESYWGGEGVKRMKEIWAYL